MGLIDDDSKKASLIKEVCAKEGEIPEERDFFDDESSSDIA